jgi:hypothetical protein
VHSVRSRIAATGPVFTAVGSLGCGHAVHSRHRYRRPGDARLLAEERVHRSLRVCRPHPATPQTTDGASDGPPIGARLGHRRRRYPDIRCAEWG